MTKINLSVNEQARKEANLRLLKRSVDRSITDILGGAVTHVVLYHFRDESQRWEKSDVEGSLSLAVRGGGGTPAAAAAGASKFVLVILNRNSPENYAMDFTSDFQLQQSDPFLIFRNYEQQQQTGTGSGDKGPATIRGIWFPNDNERTKMNDLLVEVLKSLKNNSPPPVPIPAYAPAAAPAPAPAAAAAAVPTIDRNAATASLFAALNIGTATTDSSSPSQQAQQQQAQQQQQQQAQTPTAVAARPPSSATPSPSQHSNQQQQQPMLDKKSLQLALLSLIQDERFLDLLHAQYLKVHNARTSRN